MLKLTCHPTAKSASRISGLATLQIQTPMYSSRPAADATGVASASLKSQMTSAAARSLCEIFTGSSSREGTFFVGVPCPKTMPAARATLPSLRRRAAPVQVAAPGFFRVLLVGWPSALSHFHHASGFHVPPRGWGGGQSGR